MLFRMVSVNSVVKEETVSSGNGLPFKSKLGVTRFKVLEPWTVVAIPVTVVTKLPSTKADPLPRRATAPIL